MKAAVVPQLGAPLEIREVTVPSRGPGQVLGTDHVMWTSDGDL